MTGNFFSAGLQLALCAVVCVLAFSGSSNALENGLARTPPMGWNTWNTFQCNYDEKLLREMAVRLVSSGMAKAGYNYLIVDDCWQLKERDANGNLQVDTSKFPNGMKPFVDYVHSLGLKAGIYSDVSVYTCQGLAGSGGHYEQDAKLWASWGIDYIKLDTCYLTEEIATRPWIYYGQMSDALNKTGRPIVYSVCNWGMKETWSWAPPIANLWRTTFDIFPWWGRVLEIVDAQKELWPYTRLGAWNDPDMLEVGVNGTFFNYPGFPAVSLDDTEARAHFSLWAIMAAPLIAGNDLRRMTQTTLSILTNPSVIAVDQDPLGEQGRMIASIRNGVDLNGVCLYVSCTWTEVWAKRLSSGSIAVLLFNRAGVIWDFGQWSKEDVTVTWEQLGIPANSRYLVTDLWAGRPLGHFSGQFTASQLMPHDVQFVMLSAA
jgi:alpha-galactosidase